MKMHQTFIWYIHTIPDGSTGFIKKAELVARKLRDWRSMARKYSNDGSGKASYSFKHAFF